MTKRWTHTECFQAFGTEPANVRWSWSARNEATGTVVVTLWQDVFTHREGRRIYERPATDREWLQPRPGFDEMMENLAWARDHCGGRVRVIVAIAKDRNVEPRKIAECFPNRMIMRLTRLDVATGEFVLEVEGAEDLGP